MKFVILCSDDDWQHLQQAEKNCELLRVLSIDEFLAVQQADAYFNLLQPQTKPLYTGIQAPIFINDVLSTLKENNYAENVLRVQSWPGFIGKEIWEIAGKITPKVENILQTLQKKYIQVNDTVGFVTTNTIAMIINEAYFALGENVSTVRDIDTAMKLGTNYPYGPFEWASLIGIQHIKLLLQKLALQNAKYSPAPFLIQQRN